MSRGYVKSSPRFFRLITVCGALAALALLLLAAVIPAPLQEAADPARVPNPVKAGWFLLWVQELVSYSKYLVDAVLLMAVLFVALPWLFRRPAESACWLPRDQRVVSFLSLTLFALIVALTVITLFFRGELRRRVALLVPFLLTLPIIPLQYLRLDLFVKAPAPAQVATQLASQSSSAPNTMMVTPVRMMICW